jgi:tetratricopeptide (TPR) repeat protein
VSQNAYAQSDDDRAAARIAANAGLKAYQEGRYQEAADLCNRAESLMHATTHLLIVARSQAKLGHLVEAQEAYIRIKRDQLPANAPRAFLEAQAAAADEQAALGPRVPTIKITLEGAPAKGVTLVIDGQNVSAAMVGLPKPINPGQHTIAAHAPSAESETSTVTLPEGASQSLTLTMHAVEGAPSQPAGAAAVSASGDAQPAAADQAPASGGKPGLRIAGWIGVGVGVAGAALGTVFLVKNQSDLNDANSICGGASAACPMSKMGKISDLDSSANGEATLAWVSYGVGGAALAAGITMLVMSGSKGQQTQAAVVPLAGPGYFGLRGRF